jgi:transposase
MSGLLRTSSLAIPMPAPSVAIGRRYHALYLRRLGHPPGEISPLLGVTPEAIRKWILLARTHGLDRLARRAGGVGQPPKLTPERQAAVLAWVDTEPTLMLKQLRQRIAARWGISLSTTQIWHLLKRYEARRVMPRTRHYHADTAAQRRFKKSPAPDARGVQGTLPAALPR